MRIFFLRASGLVLAVGLTVAGCGSPRSEAEPQRVLIATGNPGGVYYPLGEALARLYNARIPKVHGSAESTRASMFSLGALEAGSADLAFAPADVVYRAYIEGTKINSRPHRRLRALALIYPNVAQVLVRENSQFQSFGDLRGSRVGYLSGGSDSAPTGVDNPLSSLDLLSVAYALSPKDLKRVPLTTFREVLDGLGNGRLDAAIMVAGYPVGAIRQLAARINIRFLEIDPSSAARIRVESPFHKPAVIPAATYAGQTKAVSTFGVDNLLVCRQDLDDSLVYQLTKTFFEGLSQLAREHIVAKQVNADLASSTPIPLHPGAAWYYRERELLK